RRAAASAPTGSSRPTTARPDRRRCRTGFSGATASAMFAPPEAVMSRSKRSAVVCVCLCWALAARADERATDSFLDQTRAHWEQVARTIWDTPELGLKETRSSAALIALLEKEGFKVTRGIGDEPTAFVAVAGSGAPVVALLAEYDALPGLSQAAGQPKKK